jgi:Zn-dependent protease with chaperone function
LATDFFERQDHARRSTVRLIVLFGLAVLAIIASIEVLLAATMGYLSRNPETGAVDWAAVTDPQLIVLAVGGTLIVVGGGSLFKMAQLRAGGRVVAEQLGGRLLTPDATDPVERRVLNVVEEMAIASGTPTPPVYLMDSEDGINAFAAGFAPADAVIGVTRGTATRLTRDELQGVMAHEFSHILNGDMRLNIRLIGLLHGILIIGMLGYFMLRMSFFTGRSRRSRDSGGLPILAIGAGLAVIGFAGTFFGNMIKAAVSRQREFLADASAVQFTRQPGGLAGALKKIGGFAGGSSIQNPNAPEASHMFFGRATAGLSAMFSTHPPLDERIRRIDPSWNGEFADAPDVSGAGATAAAAAGAMGFAGGESRTPAPAAPPDVIASIGQPGPAHLQYAAQLIHSLPPDLAAAAHEPYGARAVVYALLLDRQADARTGQVAHLDEHADPGVYRETQRIWPLVETLPARLRLPLIEMALPALRTLTAAQHERFVANVVALAEADHTVDLFEWSLHRILLRDLDEQASPNRRTRIRHHSIDAVRTQCELLISTLAYVGNRNVDGAASAFEQGRAVLGLTGARIKRPDECGLDVLDPALDDLDEAAPAVKRQVLEASAACISADRHISVAEAELLRAVAASMSCPMPPILVDAAS